MIKKKMCKCAFKHCSHKSCEVSQDEAVKIGNRYFHKDCADIRNNIEQIKSLYYEKVSNTVVISQLLSVVNNIIFKKKMDSAYLLFALRFAVANNIRLNSPYGLHYLVDNNRIKTAWTKQRVSKMVSKMKYEVPIVYDEPTFKLKPSMEKGFGNIFD